MAEISKEIDGGMIEEEHDWRRRVYEVATSRDIKITLSLSCLREQMASISKTKRKIINCFSQISSLDSFKF